MRGRRTRAPDIDAGEQEQPDHVNEVPVPGRGLEAEMLLRLEVAGKGAEQADGQEDGSDRTWKPWKPVAMKKVAP